MTSHWTFFSQQQRLLFFNFQFSSGTKIAISTGMKLTSKQHTQECKFGRLVFLLETETCACWLKKYARHELNFRLMKKNVKRWIFQSFEYVRNDDVARHTELWHKITIIRMLQVIAFSLHLCFLPFIRYTRNSEDASSAACAMLMFDHRWSLLPRDLDNDSTNASLISWPFDFSFCLLRFQRVVPVPAQYKQINPCHNLSKAWDNQQTTAASRITLWNNLINQ